MTGIERITAERKRQIEQENWTAEHDDQYLNQELPMAAACYTMMAEILTRSDNEDRRQIIAEEATPPVKWPWDARWWKPSPDPVRNLEKAGALIAAEIDRLKRLEQRNG